MASIEDEWLWGWDPTPGIVSVWSASDGHASVWRRISETGVLLRENVQFRPWLLLAQLDDLRHLGARLEPEGSPGARVTYQELAGPGALRFLVRADDARTLASAVLLGATRRLGHPVGHLSELGDQEVLVLPPEEQYLVASGRTYFRDLAFDQLRRMQLDLETTGLDPDLDRIFMIAVRDPLLGSGRTTWSIGERIRVYRRKGGGAGVVASSDDEVEHEAGAPADGRDYDIDHYVRVLRDTFAERLVRALAPDDFAAVFADPDQLSLFTPPLTLMHTILTTTVPSVVELADEDED